MCPRMEITQLLSVLVPVFDHYYEQKIIIITRVFVCNFQLSSMSIIPLSHSRKDWPHLLSTLPGGSGVS